MSRTSLSLILRLVVLAMIAIIPAQSAIVSTQAQTNTSTVVFSGIVPSSGGNKHGDVVGVGTTAYISITSGSGDNRTAGYVTVNKPYTSFSVGYQSLGDADGSSAYSTAALASHPSGAMAEVFLNSSTTRAYVAYRPAGAGFGPNIEAIPRGSFRVYPDIAIFNNTTAPSSVTKMMIVWNEDNRYRYRIGTISGNASSWSGTNLVSNDTARNFPQIAADGTNGIWVAYATTEGRIRVAYWCEANSRPGCTGNFSTPTEISTGKGNFDPGITVNPIDNQPWVTYRNGDGGIFYGVRQATTGGWGVSKLVGGTATSFGPVGVAADAEGNIHVAWAGNTSGSWEVWYAFNRANTPAGQSPWIGPKQLSSDGQLDANTRVGATLDDFAYGHVVNETFPSSGLVARYHAVRSPGGGCTGTIQLTGNRVNGTIATTNEIGYTITPGSNCSISANTQMQLSLSPITSKTTPAPTLYKSTGTITIPTDQFGLQCTQRVYAHLYKDGTASFSPAQVFSDDITIDATGDVDALVQALNPNAGLVTTYTPFDAPGSTGASRGDTAWTRDSQYLLRIRSAGDCSGLATYKVNNITKDIVNNTVDTVLAMTDDQKATVGLKTIGTTLVDNALNIKDFESQINYDPADLPGSQAGSGGGLPVIQTGSLINDNQTPGANLSIIRTLTFSDVKVLDNLYRPNNPGTQFWGVWVAIAKDPTTSVDLSTLHWVPIKVESPAQSFSLRLNLFGPRPEFPNGVPPLTNQAGKYRVYVRFLDGAGNPSSASTAISTEFTLAEGYRLPSSSLPIVKK